MSISRLNCRFQLVQSWSAGNLFSLLMDDHFVTIGPVSNIRLQKLSGDGSVQYLNGWDFVT